ncbi:hypothetical protein [Sphingomonas sp. ACRSK]|uniref:hypothetical protein n=1 Tax=Sphingomonas sp. ACRSK TaxID=2918213 RepID=UPI001EF5B514|nr:hypothetical protein [Sphingomonas sp. ACRSK]
MSLIPWRAVRPDETLSYEGVDPLPLCAFSAAMTELADTQEVGEDAAVALQEAYDAQTDVLETVVAHLEEATAVVDAARNFMTVLAQRTHGGAPLFLINDNAASGEADTLRHAIVTLQAHLEGTELPQLVAVDRVTH